MVGKASTESVRNFYRTKIWARARDAYKHKVIFCERCGDVGVQVHHKIRLTPANIHDPMIALDENNLELLCARCHEKEHGKHVMRADEAGHVELDTPPSGN